MTYDLNDMDISLTQLFKMIKPFDTIILKKNKTYFEKLYLDVSDISIIGDNSIIEFNALASDIIPSSLGGDGVKKYGTTGSATFTVLPSANNFKCLDVTFINSTTSLNKHRQAVAFKSEASNMLLVKCNFISGQDTFYLDYGKNNEIDECYFEGDIDFIFGSSDATFNRCQIKSRDSERAYFLAPDTFQSNTKGFIFNECYFYANAKYNSIGRCWYASKAREKIYPRATLNNCKILGNVELDLIQMHENDPREYEFSMNNCDYNGTLINIKH